jgi:hypothetical protein
LSGRSGSVADKDEVRLLITTIILEVPHGHPRVGNKEQSFESITMGGRLL